VIFISYDEPNADQNFARLLGFAPTAKRVHGVHGIVNAHHKAAQIADSDYFFVVDGDNWISDGFRFDRPEIELSGKYLWPSRNAVNGLVWGNGGIKLLKKEDLLSVQDDSVDFFVRMNGALKVLNIIASETRFNSSPLLAWRCGFRECAKMAAGLFKTKNMDKVLEIWQNIGADKLNGNWCMLGSRLGAAYGKANAGSSSLRLINDMDWLGTEFLNCRESVVDRPI